MDPQRKKHNSTERVERRRQLWTADTTSGTDDDGLIFTTRSTKQPTVDVKRYSKALHELFRAIQNHPDLFEDDHHVQSSNEDLSKDSIDANYQDSSVLFTETDVTLPSCLDWSPGPQDIETNERFQRAHQLPHSRSHSSQVLAEVFQQMMTIYEQLREKRQSQQQWEKELQERERRLKQQEEAFVNLTGLEEMLHSRILAAEEKHQQEVRQLQNLLRERAKENRRLKSSFDTIRDLNDNMKKQLQEIREQNKKLESQSRRVQARLQNLQKKYDYSAASRGCQRACASDTECLKPSRKEKTAASGNHNKKGSSCHMPAKLLSLLLEWVLDGQTFSSVAANKGKSVYQCLPSEVILNERCLKVLPLLADQLNHTPASEAELLLKLLCLIHCTLRHVDNSSKHVALSATLRRMGEQLSKLPAPTVSEPEDPELHSVCSVAATGSSYSWPLYRSPCPHTRILSILIILRTVTQADVLAQALNSLHNELISVESRGLFIHYEGVCVLMSMLHAGHGGLQTALDILMQLTQQSRHLNSFLEACSCEQFFHTTSKLLKNTYLELSSLEKLSILLQKLSSIKKNRRLFETSSLHLQIKELFDKTDHTCTFLCLNLTSILHNLQ